MSNESTETNELEALDLGPIAEALRLLRTRRDLTQTAAGQLDDAPDFRTLSHWETRHPGRQRAPSVETAGAGAELHRLELLFKALVAVLKQKNLITDSDLTEAIKKARALAL